MKKRIWIVFLVLHLTAFSESSWGAVNQLSLTDAISIAQKNNPDLRKAELELGSSQWGQWEALSAHLPHLEVRGAHLLGARYSNLSVVFSGSPIQFPTAFPQTHLEIEASILLFDGLGSIHKYQAARLTKEASQLEMDDIQFKLEKNIQVKFFQALAAEELVKVADQNIETLEQHLNLVQASVRAGMSTQVDVLRIESQLEEARAEKLLAEDNVWIGRQALIEVVGIEESDSPTLLGELPALKRKKLPEDLDLDLSLRRDFQAMERRERAQDKLRAASDAFWFPKVSLFGTEQFLRYGAFDPVILPNSSYQNAYSFGFQVSWNLFDGGRSIALEGKANNQAKMMKEDLRKLHLTSRQEFESWKRRFTYFVALYEARKRSVRKSDESVRLATAAVQAGLKTHSEVLDAELELFRARAGVIRAQLGALEAWIQIELASGKNIEI